MNLIFLIISLVINIGLLIVLLNFWKQLKQKLELDIETEKENSELLERNKELQELNNRWEKSIDVAITQKNSLESVLQGLRVDKRNALQELENLESTASKMSEDLKSVSRFAYEQYCEVLDEQYKKTEQEYFNEMEMLKTSYATAQMNLLKQFNEVKADLEKVEQTRAAAIQAQVKEKEIKENLSFYCLKLSDMDKADIDILETIKPKLNKPRVLSMLIWSTFYQKQMTSLCNNVLGTAQVTGIYKITNQKTGECYIGQAVNNRPVKNFS